MNSHVWPRMGRKLAVGTMALLLTMVAIASADIRLPAVIGDNMVLQQGKEVAIWGWADPGERVRLRLSWDGEEQTTDADGNGQWFFTIAAPPAGGPYEMTLSGKNTVRIRNVASGEVWVCSGQSNMEWPLHSAANGSQEVAAADYPNIRLFTVQKKIADTPQDDCTGQWSPCSPETAPGFSAVGYFFGRHLHRELNVPIGLINTSWGGTVAEAWTSANALETMPEFKAQMNQIARAKADPDGSLKTYREELAQWQKKIESAGAEGAGCIEPGFDDSTWQQMGLPVLWEQAGLADFDGLVWFRKTVTIPDSWAGKELTLDLGPIDDMDTTWFNGVKVGGHNESGQWQVARRYKVPADLVRAGRNIIVVQVLDTGGGGGIYGQAEQMNLRQADADDAVSLAGTWRYKVGYDLASMPLQPQPPVWVNNPNAPTALYNGMIAPLIPLGIRGAIWYQGESNASRAYQYRELFPTMISNWREDWGQGPFPFLFVQLANFMATRPEPGDCAWAELREAQTMTLTLENTGMAVIIDIGQADDIHPRNKQDVGKRLALWALAKIHGKAIAWSGPLYRSMKVDGDEIVLHFDHVNGGLVAEGEPLKGFAVAGADRKFVWADARIDGSTVVVRSDKVARPVAVRYAWADNPVCNLYNGAGLPASPFRTDDWPGITAGKK